jgi:hypothetical protein
MYYFLAKQRRHTARFILLCSSLTSGRKLELAILMGIVSFVACLFSTTGCHFMRVEAIYGDVSTVYSCSVSPYRFIIFSLFATNCHVFFGIIIAIELS